jgi:3-hydroxyisobutyrate dehydrogenase
MATSVGFIGVGNMGNPMAGNVLKGGFQFTVFDKSPKAMENLVQAGARAGKSAQGRRRRERDRAHLPAGLAGRRGALPGARRPRRARAPEHPADRPQQRAPLHTAQARGRGKKRGVHFLEAPVSGGTSGAKAATLAIMVGGDPR